MMGELFASDVKGVASAIAVMFNWTLVFIITKTFGMMQIAWGSGEFEDHCKLFTIYNISSFQVQLSTSLLASWSSEQFSCSSKYRKQKESRMLKFKQFLQEKIRPEDFKTIQKTQHSQHHHIETKFLSQDFFKMFVLS